MNANRVAVAEGVALKIDCAQCQARHTERIDSRLRAQSGMCGASAEHDFLDQESVEPGWCKVGVPAVHHHGDIDVIENPFGNQLLLAAGPADSVFREQFLIVIFRVMLLRRNRNQSNISA